MTKKYCVPAAMGIALGLLFLNCSKNDETTQPPSIPWALPLEEVVDGGTGVDGIPAIENPQFADATAVDFLDENDLVLGIKIGDDIRAYPHYVLDWHEVVNDSVNGIPMAITYCPLTGTGVAWAREINGAVTTFGVSGLIYNANILPYDRATNSVWSQMLLKGVSGANINTPVQSYPMLEMTWKTWLAMFPNSKVLNTQTGFNLNYEFYPYDDYRTNHALLVFPIKPDDNRLPRKRRGMGIIVQEKAKFYEFGNFMDQVVVRQDVFETIDFVLVGSQQQNFQAAYERRLADGTLLDFSALNETGNPVVMTDNEGNAWNIFGEAVSGPRTGTQLKSATRMIGYWLGFGAFYPGVELYQ
jgi:hypothetical protein